MPKSAFISVRRRMVRELVRRAGRYERLSIGPAFLFGAITMAISSLAAGNSAIGQRVSFEAVWVGVFALCLAGATAVLWHDARRHHRSLFNRPFAFATLSFLPALLAGAGITFAAAVTRTPPLTLVGFWMLFYGLTLLGAMAFAPRTILILGAVFLISGIVLIGTISSRLALFIQMDSLVAGYWMMGCTFGLYHLAYAWIVWRTPLQSGGLAGSFTEGPSPASGADLRR